MADKNDPLGYYGTLGVKKNSETEEIKKAYKKKAMEFHPDRNNDSNATKKFQEIQKAYDVLIDPVSRAQYDLYGLNENITSHKDKNHNHDPIRCSKCNEISAQPRYFILYRIVSIFVMSYKTPIQGIFCNKCASKEGFKQSGLTWLFGWWGFPWGPIWSIQALFKNMIGGEELNAHNANILLHQSIYFLSKGNLKLGKAIALKALELITKAKKEPKQGNLTLKDIEHTREFIIQLLANEYKNVESMNLKDLYGFQSLFFLSQFIMGSLILIWFFSQN